MLFMGNHPQSSADCYERVCTLIKLQSQLSGIQQLGTGPKADYKLQKQELEEFKEDAHSFIQQLKRDFLKEE